MSTEKTFPEGIRVFPKMEKQPEFVIASIVITPNDLITWLKANEHLLSDYNGKKQLKLQLLQGKENKPYLQVDTYKAAPKKDQTIDPPHNDLPF